MYKFEKLEVYQVALEYADLFYTLPKKKPPKSKEDNLKSQIIRATTSVVLNIAEASTSQNDAEQRRFLDMCQQLIERRRCISKEELS